MSASMPAAYVDAFFDFYVTGTLDESRPQPDVREVTGRPPRTFRQWAHAGAHPEPSADDEHLGGLRPGTRHR
jgi:hypothetical protein